MKRIKNKCLHKKDRYDQLIVNMVWDYHKQNESEVWLKGTFKEALHSYRIYKYFDDTFFKRTHEFDMNVAVADLRKILPSLEFVYKQFKGNITGTPYGASEDYGNLSYVSDRWGCDFRLQWLIQLANRNEVYEQVDCGYAMEWHIKGND